MAAYLALFDMDRTLMSVNTAAKYVRWRRRHGHNTTGDVLRVAYWLVKYKFGLLDAQRIAERVMSEFRNDREDELRTNFAEWYRIEGRRFIVSEGRATVERHRNAGAVVAIVTSATRYAAAPLAHELRIPHVLCTDLEVDNLGRFTGRLIEPMCYGKGKIERVQCLAVELGHNIRQAYFYTDSITDAPLLELVGHPVAVNPDPRLRRLAKAREWRIEEWRDV